MRIKYTCLFPLVYFVLAILSPFLGPLGMIMAFVGMPLSYIANNWYLKYGDPTFVAILGGTIQCLMVGFVLDLILKVYRKRKGQG
jgi:hypothetical protein